jgi:uncharacterized membrane protein
MPSAAEFLDERGRQAVAAAIAQAEAGTGAEVRVHLEDHIEEDVLDHAVFIFEELGMQRTRWRNAVLIYIAVADRSVAVIGDSGVNAVVPAGYWDDELEHLRTHFRRGAHAEGLDAAVRMVGHKLAEHFPRTDDDIDELSNEVSIGRAGHPDRTARR